MLGSALAIGGSYLYALTKHAEKVAEQAKKAAEADAALVDEVRSATPLEVRTAREQPADGGDA